MAEDLPEPASRKEQYLAKAAGMDVDELPTPASREEQYLNAIAEGGGGGGGTSNFNDLSNRPKYNNTTMTGDTNIPEVKTYSNFTGTDGTSAGAAGLVPAPATTDAGKFLKADGTWNTAGGSVKVLTSADYNWPTNNPDGIAMWLLPDGDYTTDLTTDYIYPDNSASKNYWRYFSKITDINSAIAYFTNTDSDNAWRYWNTNKNTGARIAFGRMSPAVVQTVGSSTTDVMSQNAVSRMIYEKVGSDEYRAINIRGSSGIDSASGSISVAIGEGAYSRGENSVAVGSGATIYAAGEYSTAIGSTAKTEGHSRAVALGNAANAAFNNSVAIGTNAITTRVGEVNVGAGTSGRGYNSTNYRVIGGVHDPVDNHDAATKGYVDAHSGGAPTFYIAESDMPNDLGQSTSNINIYSDAALTTPITGEALRAALASNGMATFVVNSSSANCDYKYNVMGSWVPTANALSQGTTPLMAVCFDPLFESKLQIVAGSANAGEFGATLSAFAQ